jgi:cell wall-associated NlpC family hydrolase
MRWGSEVRRLFIAALTLTVLVAALVLPTDARADQISDKRAQAEAIAAKISTLDRSIEKAAEAANGAQVELDGINGEIASAQARVAAAEAQRATRTGEMKSYAVDAYVHGGPSNSVSPGDDLGVLAQQQGYLAAAAAKQQQVVDELRSSQQDIAVQVGELNKAKGAAEAKTKQLRDRKAAAQAAVNEQNDLYAKAQGELAGLVSQAQAREAERQAAAGRTRQSRRGATPASFGPAPAVRGGVAAVIAEAKAQLGKPYVWGAAGPGSFDCSGLTMWAWHAGGVNLPHFSGAQYSATRHVPLSAIQPGDLVFYESPSEHVALYIGNGTIIHAPNPRSVVRYDSLYYWDTAMLVSRP